MQRHKHMDPPKGQRLERTKHEGSGKVALVFGGRAIGDSR